ncbi:MAG: D-cysteine desulfhydrase family protein [Chloroflexi bacterium]|nr:MAG: D-cysteine desulfhydrase family protein [Chloroflexota bacterium]
MAQTTGARVYGRQELVDLIGALPRVRIAHLPTPLEEAPRLRAALGPDAPRILIKRDDLTGFALGGNKVRHMEFRMGDIRAKGADSLVVMNVAQSNHARLHSSLAARFGLDAYIVKIPSRKDEPVNGNLLLDHIVGAHIINAPSAAPDDLQATFARVLGDLRAQGRVVYDVPNDPVSKAAGACGYLLASVELLEQLDALGVSAQHIFLASGTSSAGLALGGKLLGAPWRVHAISIDNPAATVEAYMCAAANGAAALLGLAELLEPGDADVTDAFIGERYGVPSAAGLEALALAGRTEGLIVDPVYTGKALSALVHAVRAGEIGRDETVIFVHTGGLPITFAYAEEILEGIA